MQHIKYLFMDSDSPSALLLWHRDARLPFHIPQISAIIELAFR